MACLSHTKFLHITPFIILPLWFLLQSYSQFPPPTFLNAYSTLKLSILDYFYQFVSTFLFYELCAHSELLKTCTLPFSAPSWDHISSSSRSIAGNGHLCKVGNPSSHLFYGGNFAGAISAAKMGWIEVANFSWQLALCIALPCDHIKDCQQEKLSLRSYILWILYSLQPHQLHYCLGNYLR